MKRTPAVRTTGWTFDNDGTHTFSYHLAPCGSTPGESQQEAGSAGGLAEELRPRTKGRQTGRREDHSGARCLTRKPVRRNSRKETRRPLRTPISAGGGEAEKPGSVCHSFWGEFL